MSEIKRTTDEMETFAPSADDLFGLWEWDSNDLIVSQPEIDKSLPF